MGGHGSVPQLAPSKRASLTVWVSVTLNVNTHVRPPLGCDLAQSLKLVLNKGGYLVFDLPIASSGNPGWLVGQ